MALWDSDRKGSKMRLEPVTDKQDTIDGEHRLAHGTSVFTLKDEGDSSTVYLKIVDGKIEVINSSGNTVSRLGYRSSDQDGAVDVAKPGDSV